MTAKISATCASSCRCVSESRFLLKEIEFRDFRNLTNARWQPGEGSHLLFGANGAGKTSLLEAVYLLATTKSFRTPRLEECRRRGCRGFSLKGRSEMPNRFDLEIDWTPSGSRRLKNGSSVSGSRYLEALPIISWSAADLKVIEGSPGNRRRFLDQGIVARRPATIEVLSRYRRCLEQKREVLRQGGPDLEVWNELLSAAAADLMSRRSRYVARLSESLAGVVERARVSLPEVSLEYRPSLQSSEMTAAEILAVLEAERRREVEQQRALLGPHRDELAIWWAGVEVSKIASAGERKLLGMLLCAARIELLREVGRTPVVLLDDVDAELDGERLSAVWGLFEASPQVIASTSHEAVIGALQKVTIWPLDQGSIGPSSIS